MSRTVLPSGKPLVGKYVTLQLLIQEDLAELAPLLNDPAIYSHGYVMHRRPVDADDALLVAQSFLAQQGTADGRSGGRTAYSVRLATTGPLGDAGTLVGTTSLWEADLHNEKIHLGSTLYGRAWWGTQVNPEAKMLLLAHCFEACGYGRVKIQTDVLNTRSQAAIARLGALREGVTRRDMKREDGSFRDSVVFSILADEWLSVKAGLQARLWQAEMSATDA